MRDFLQQVPSMGNALRHLRESRGWTHQEAADRMGVSRGQFIKLERNERQLTARTIDLAARAFDVGPADILAPDNERERRDLPGILKRIEHRLAVVGLSATVASRRVGRPDAIRDLQRAVNGGRGGISTATLNALAAVLGTTSVWLFAGAGPEEPGAGNTPSAGETHGAVQLTSRFVRVEYGGKVEAGTYRVVDDFEDDPNRAPYYHPVDREFPNAKLFYFDVAGDSMNDLKPRPLFEGDRVICLDYESMGGRVPPRDGMVVVVEQTLDGGHHRERSVKQIEIFRERTEFHPRSTNKRHKPIIVPREGEDDPLEGRMVRILAIVRQIAIDVAV